MNIDIEKLRSGLRSAIIKTGLGETPWGSSVEGAQEAEEKLTRAVDSVVTFLQEDVAMDTNISKVRVEYFKSSGKWYATDFYRGESQLTLFNFRPEYDRLVSNEYAPGLMSDGRSYFKVLTPINCNGEELAPILIHPEKYP